MKKCKNCGCVDPTSPVVDSDPNGPDDKVTYDKPDEPLRTLATTLNDCLTWEWGTESETQAVEDVIRQIAFEFNLDVKTSRTVTITVPE